MSRRRLLAASLLLFMFVGCRGTTVQPTRIVFRVPSPIVPLDPQPRQRLAIQPEGESERAARPTVARPSVGRAAPAGDVFDMLARCESGGDPMANTGNGFEGAFQFSPATWQSMGTDYAHAYDASYEVQKDTARRLQARSGWGRNWPACSQKLGLT